jgi:tetratricopeptide (TPR) repeat protein
MLPRPSSCGRAALAALAALITLGLAAGATPVRGAQERPVELILEVVTLAGQPIPRLRLQSTGSGAPAEPTDDRGTTRLSLPPHALPGTWIALEIAEPADRHIVVEPWDGWLTVPRSGRARIVVEARGSALLLRDPRAQSALAQSFVQAIGPSFIAWEVTSPRERRQRALAQVAARLRHPPAEVEKAFRSWAREACTSYDRGLVALAADDARHASNLLAEFIEKSGDQLLARTRFLAQALIYDGEPRWGGEFCRGVLALRADDPELPRCVGITRFAAGSPDEAASWIDRAYEVAAAALGPDHPRTLRIAADRAALHFALDDLESALALQEAVAAAEERVLGADHPDTLRTRNDLVKILSALGHWDEALALQREVAERRRTVLGTDHPDSLRSSNNLAVLLYRRGEVVPAAEIQEQVVSAWKAIQGLDHPATLTVLDNLAAILHHTWPARARPVQAEILDRREKLLGPHHPATTASAWSALVNLDRLGEPAAAEAETVRAKLDWLLAAPDETLAPEQREIRALLSARDAEREDDGRLDPRTGAGF